jgi:hypothetical protein
VLFRCNYFSVRFGFGFFSSIVSIRFDVDFSKQRFDSIKYSTFRFDLFFVTTSGSIRFFLRLFPIRYDFILHLSFGSMSVFLSQLPMSSNTGFSNPTSSFRDEGELRSQVQRDVLYGLWTAPEGLN